MKSFVITSLLTIILLITGFFVFGNGKISGNIPKDDEQLGLSKQIVIRFSHVVSENTPKGLAAQKFAELVHEKTDGRVKVEVYPNGILYPDGEELDALERGDIQMAAPSFSKMTAIVPEWKVLDLPFLFKDEGHVEKVFTGPAGDELLAKLNRKQMYGLAFWSNGFKQMTSSKKQLIKPSDFKGQTFRVMPSEVLEKQFQLLGANPVPTPFNEVYSTLEQHKVDGQENTISNIYSKSLYQHQKNLTISNHGYLGYAVIINKPFWDSLPVDIQEKIEEATTETTRWILHESERMNEKQLTEIQEKADLAIHQLSDDEKRKWEEAFLPLYEEAMESPGSALLEKIKEEGQ